MTANNAVEATEYRASAVTLALENAMRRTAIMMMLLAVGTWCKAETKDPVVGTWVQRHYRTVIGTGPADTVVRIRAEAGSYHASYTLGGISIVKGPDGRQVFKTVNTTYDRLPLQKTAEGYVFVVPEGGPAVQILVKDGSVEIKSNLSQSSTEWKFEKLKANQTSEATSEPAPSAASSSPQG